MPGADSGHQQPRASHQRAGGSLPRSAAVVVQQGCLLPRLPPAPTAATRRYADTPTAATVSRQRAASDEPPPARSTLTSTVQQRSLQNNAMIQSFESLDWTRTSSDDQSTMDLRLTL